MESEEKKMSIVDSVSKAMVPIHREGWPFIAIALVATLVIGWFIDPLFWIGLFLTGWVCYFFRDPKRVTPVGEAGDFSGRWCRQPCWPGTPAC